MIALVLPAPFTKIGNDIYLHGGTGAAEAELRRFAKFQPFWKCFSTAKNFGQSLYLAVSSVDNDVLNLNLICGGCDMDFDIANVEVVVDLVVRLNVKGLQPVRAR